MKNTFTLFILLFSLKTYALDPNHFTINRITAPYFIVDGNSPAIITTAYVGFEVKNNSNSATTYSGLKFTITSIGTSVVGQNYSIVAPSSGIVNIGTLAPGQSKICYFYVAYPANITPQATFNIQLSDNTVSSKTQSFVIRNRSSISANAGGAATQTFTNQDLIGGIILDDVTYAVGNVQNGDESDFQVAVSSQFDPTKITLLGTQVLTSTVPGIVAGATDSLYFITGNGSTGASVTIRWIFRITGYNFTTYLLPCAGATSGSTNYKYALNTNLGSGSPVTVSSTANPLTITKTSDKSLYGTTTIAVFTITITNPGAYGTTIDKITDQLPIGFTFQAFHAASEVTASNSTSVPSTGATGNITFEGGVVAGANTSYYIPAGGSLTVKYTATTSSSTASNLLTVAKDYVAATEVGSAQNIVSVSATLPLTLASFKGSWQNSMVKLDWITSSETNSDVFEVERNINNQGYSKIGELPAGGTTNGITSYSFTDTFPVAGINTYRLKMVDRDQHYQYSAVVSLSKKQGGGLAIQQVFPNPFISNIGVAFVADKKQTISINITDITGKTVFQKLKTIKQGGGTIEIEGLNTLKAGIYLLQIKTIEASYVEKLVKTN